MATVVLVVALAGLCLPLEFEPASIALLASLGIQLLHSLPRMRTWRSRWTLAALAVLFLLGGSAGFLAGSTLLIIRGRWRWVAFASVAVVAGATNTMSPYDAANATVNAVSQGLVVFGLTRLSDLRRELLRTRERLVAESIRRTRERASADLDAAIGTAFSEIMAFAREQKLAEVAATARAASRRVRETGSVGSDVAPPPRSVDLTPRLAWPILVVVLVQYPIVATLYIVSADPPEALLAAYVATPFVVALLQGYHSLPRPPGVRPRLAAVTMPLLMLLACAPLFGPDQAYPQLVGFAAGSVLIVLGGTTRAWFGFAGLVAYVATVLMARGTDAMAVTYWSLETVTSAMLFYGLALMTHAVHQVREARQALASLSTATEDRRIAADVHDLLGYGFSAIIAKAELAAREPANLQRHLADITGLAEKSLADLGTIADGATALSLTSELDSAREVLTASGVAADVDEPPRLDDAVDRLLATVVREAVTNVIRHADARRVEIRLSLVGDEIRLRIANDSDGEPGRTLAGAKPSGGQGLQNLARRVRAKGGILGAEPSGDGFVLEVSHPAGVGRDPHSVDPVAGR